jgi:cytochrome P450
MNNTISEPEKYANIFDPTIANYSEFIFPVIEQMRREDPFYRTELPVPAWMITRYDDVSALLNNKNLNPTFDHAITFNTIPEAERIALTPLKECFQHWFINSSTDRHRAMQQIFRRYFTAKAVRALEPRIQKMIDLFLALISPSQENNIINRLCYPLPAAVIAEILGVPEEDHSLFVAWSKPMLKSYSPYNFEDYLEAQEGVVSMMDYCEARLKKAPHNTDNIINVMAQAVAANEMSQKEAVVNTVMMLFAGHETTATMLGSCLQYTVEFSHQWEKVKSNPDRLGDFISETLRFRGTTVASWRRRFVLNTFDYKGHTFQQGDIIFLSIISANRDDDQFFTANEFNIDRTNNDKHMSFGYGTHYCLGAALANLELELVMKTLLTRHPNMHIDLKNSEYTYPAARLPRLIALPVILSPNNDAHSGTSESRNRMTSDEAENTG